MRLAVLIVAGLVAGAARAQVADVLARPPERMVSALPAGWEAALLVNDATRQRESEAGRQLIEMLREVGAAPETSAAWEAFAKAMDWTQTQAFDLLMGKRFTLVVRGLSGEPDWAAITEVSPEAEQRLRERLRASPRGNLNGLAVLAVEDGKYELMVGRGGEGDEPGRTATVLLGPGGNNPLFTELAPQLRTRTGLALPAQAWRAGQKERECDIAFMLRRGPDKTLTLTARLEARGWDAKLVCSPGMVWGGTHRAMKSWSDVPFRVMERDALIGVMGVTGGASLPGAAWALLGADPAMWPAAEGQLAAFFVHPVRGRAPAREREEPRVVLLDRDAARSMPERGGEAVTTVGGWCAVFGLESARSESGRAAALAERILEGLRSGRMPASAAPGADMSEAGFSSVRIADIGEVHGSLAPRLARLVGDDPVLSWGTTPARGVAAAHGESRGVAAWDVASVSPAASETAADAAVLASGAGGTVRTWLSIGLVRPCALASLLGKDDETVPAWARRVESLRWEAHVREDGMVESAVGVRMAR